VAKHEHHSVPCTYDSLVFLDQLRTDSHDHTADRTANKPNVNHRSLQHVQSFMHKMSTIKHSGICSLLDAIFHPQWLINMHFQGNFPSMDSNHNPNREPNTLHQSCNMVAHLLQRRINMCFHGYFFNPMNFPSNLYQVFSVAQCSVYGDPQVDRNEVMSELLAFHGHSSFWAALVFNRWNTLNIILDRLVLKQQVWQYGAIRSMSVLGCIPVLQKSRLASTKQMSSAYTNLRPAVTGKLLV